VTKGILVLSNGSGTSFKKSSKVTLKTTAVTGAPAARVSGLKLSLSFKGAKACKATTTSAGLASCAVTSPSKVGASQLVMTYAGNVDYAAATKSFPVTVHK
jgi:hypothetical protein